MQHGAGVPVVTAALVAGALAPAGASIPSRGVAVLAAVALGAAAILPQRRRLPALGLAAALAAFAVGAARSRAVLYPLLPPHHVAHLELPVHTTLVARVVAPPEQRRRQTILLVEAEQVAEAGTLRRTEGRVRLALRRPGRRWRYADRLRVTTTLRLPRNFENPGRFDYVTHLAGRGVYVTASVWDASTVRRLPAARHGLRLRIERWRARVSTLIGAWVPVPRGALLRALVLGDQGGIPEDLREAFMRAGVVHVLSVSGLHVALVAAGAFGLCYRILGRSERLLLSAPVRPLAAALALLPVALYAVLSGLGIPVLRAVAMIGAATAGRLLGRSIDPLRSLVLAALVLALAFPTAALDVGAQLSFASVAAIAWGARRLGAGGPGTAGWRETLLASPCALVGTAPLTAFHFGQVSVVALIANPVVVPIFGSAVVLLGLFGAVVEPFSHPVAGASFAAAGQLLRIGVSAVRAFAAVPGGAIAVPTPSLLELGFIYSLLAGLVIRGSRRRALVVLAISGLLVDGAWRALTLPPHAVRVTFLDVGQGDAAVVELPGGRTLVVDAGGFPGSEFDTGEGVVAPFLRQRGILHPDALVMTHAHPDHAGGLASLLQHYRPREFWWTGVPGSGPRWRRLERSIAASGARVRVLSTRAALPGFARGVAVLHPDDPLGLSLNDSSLTLRLEAATGGAVLLTGDIEAAAEARVLRSGAPLGSTVLKVPHHGSRTSSGPGFVAAIGADVAVMSVGADNRYGLPAPAIEARYRAAGACVLRTDRCGAITVTLDGRTPRVNTERPGCGCPSRARP